MKRKSEEYQRGFIAGLRKGVTHGSDRRPGQSGHRARETRTGPSSVAGVAFPRLPELGSEGCALRPSFGAVV